MTEETEEFKRVERKSNSLRLFICVAALFEYFTHSSIFLIFCIIVLKLNITCYFPLLSIFLQVLHVVNLWNTVFFCNITKSRCANGL